MRDYPDPEKNPWWDDMPINRPFLVKHIDFSDSKKSCWSIGICEYEDGLHEVQVHLMVGGLISHYRFVNKEIILDFKELPKN